MTTKINFLIWKEKFGDTKYLYTNLRTNTLLKLYKELNFELNMDEHNWTQQITMEIEEACFNKVFITNPNLNGSIYINSEKSDLFVSSYTVICQNILYNISKEDQDENRQYIIAELKNGKLKASEIPYLSIIELNPSMIKRICPEINTNEDIQIEYKKSMFYKCGICKLPCEEKPIHTSGGDEATKVSLSCRNCNWSKKVG